jgi:putative oxidoreductase
LSYAYTIQNANARFGRAAASVRAAFRTNDDAGLAVLRIALGAILFPHGAQHLLGWFGGYGFSGTLGWMTSVGFPGPLAVIAIVVEFLAPIALVTGIGGRLAALGVVGLMLGAASTHVQNGFFMNWFGQMPAGAEGFEYHLLMIAMAVAIVIGGSGAWSVDRLLSRER